MSRTKKTLTEAEVRVIEELDDIAINSLIWKDGTGTYQRIILGAAGTALLGKGATTIPEFAQIDLTSGITGVLPIANGGTSGATKLAGFNALSPVTTKGDIIVRNGTNNIRLGVGTNTYVLSADSSEDSGLKWIPVAGGGDVTGPAGATDNNIMVADGITGKLLKDGLKTIAQVLARANHTGTQTASTISDFDTEVSNNTDVADNTTHRGSSGVDHSYIDQDVTSGSSPTFDGANMTGVDSSNVDIPVIGATYSTVQGFIQTQGSTGHTSGGLITDAGSQTYDVASGTGFIRSTDSDVGSIISFDFAGVSAQTITDATVEYVFVDYNAGSPVINIKTVFTNDGHTEFLIGSIVREGTVLHIFNNPDTIANFAENANERWRHQGFTWAGGLALGETGTRNITKTAGEMYYKTNELIYGAYDTSVADVFDTYVAGVQEATAQTQWDNDNYDNAGTLTALSVNRYGVLWIYGCSDGCVTITYGISNTVSSAGAEAEAIPTVLPLRTTEQGFLLGRIIFQKGAATATEIQSAFTVTFNGTLSSTHNNQAGLQGGTVDEYYHMTATEYTGTGTGTPVRATSPTLVTPLLGTPTSGILTNLTGLPIIAGTTGTLSIARGGTGATTLAGASIPTYTSTNTFTNKRITARTGTTTSSATPTINTDSVDFYSLTAQSEAITSFTTNLSGTPTENQKLWIAITGTAARAITWGASFEASTIALPTTTVSTDRLDVGFVWNTVTSKWKCVAVA